jgi:hypothetical protein
MVEQATVLLVNLIQIPEELVEMLQDISLNATQA